MKPSTFWVTVLLLTLSTYTLSAQPAIMAAVNSADYSTDLAPGAEVSIFGTAFAANATSALFYPLPTTLGGVSVQLTNGAVNSLIPLFFVSPTQINAQLPYGLQGSVSLSVVTAAGTGPATVVKIAPNAPKFFTINAQGTGFITATHSDLSFVTRSSPVLPGETISLFMNSVGAVNPPIAAGSVPGDGSAGKPLELIADPVSVKLDNLTAKLGFAGLTPGTPGLYQVNFTAPYDDKLGDAAIAVTVGSGVTQGSVTVPVRANGLYFAIMGGKFVNGQVFTGATGPSSSLAFRHNSTPSFGSDGLNAWTKNTQLPASFSAVAGLALTLKSGGSIIYDNNGIEAASTGTFYTTSPGRNSLFAMSNLSSPSSPANTVQGVFAGNFRITQSTTVDQIIGYFEGPLNVAPPFDPANLYNTFRMNIFSSVAGSPKETGSYTGDVFTTDIAPGTFTTSDTGVTRLASDGTVLSIYRLVYTLKPPITLQAGDYWFTHDVATPPASGAAAETELSVGRVSHAALETLRPTNKVKE